MTEFVIVMAVILGFTAVFVVATQHAAEQFARRHRCDCAGCQMYRSGDL